MPGLLSSYRFGGSGRRPLTTPTQSTPYWDAATKHSTVTLSNFTRTAYAGNPGPAHASAKSTTTRASGRCYFEVKYDNLVSTFAANVGIMTASEWTNTTLIGVTGGLHSFSLDMSNGRVYVNGTLSVTLGAFALNDVAAFCVDQTYGLGWIKKVGGNWNNSPSADPYEEIGGIDISTLGGAPSVITIGFADQDDTGDWQGTLNAGHEAFAGTMPGEYVAW